MSIRALVGIAMGIYFILFQPFSGSSWAGIFLILWSGFWLVITWKASKRASLTTGQIGESLMAASISKEILDKADKALTEGDYQKAQELANQVLNLVPNIDVSEAQSARTRAKKIITSLRQAAPTSVSTKKISPKSEARKATSMATLIEDGNIVKKISPELAVQNVKSIDALIEDGKLIDAENQLKELMKHKVDDKANSHAELSAITSIAACAISLKNAKKKASMDFDI